MAKRTRYDVLPSEDGWKVKRQGGDRASATLPTKDQAVERAKELAKKQVPGQVIVRRRDGTIQTEYTYGDDPFPPRG